MLHTKVQGKGAPGLVVLEAPAPTAEKTWGHENGCVAGGNPDYFSPDFSLWAI